MGAWHIEGSIEVLVIIMTLVFERWNFLSYIAKFGMPATTKASTVLLEELETFQDSLLARVLPKVMLAIKAGPMEDNEVPHDCKVKNV